MDLLYSTEKALKRIIKYCAFNDYELTFSEHFEKKIGNKEKYIIYYYLSLKHQERSIMFCESNNELLNIAKKIKYYLYPTEEQEQEAIYNYVDTDSIIDLYELNIHKKETDDIFTIYIENKYNNEAFNFLADLFEKIAVNYFPPTDTTSKFEFIGKENKNVKWKYYDYNGNIIDKKKIIKPEELPRFLDDIYEKLTASKKEGN